MRALCVERMGVVLGILLAIPTPRARSEEPILLWADANVAAPGGQSAARTFGDGVHSLRVVRDAWVQLRPGTARRIGQIAKDTRVRWQGASEAGDASCPRWIAIEPRGWICESDLEPSELDPSGTRFPVIREGYLLPERYGEVLPTPEHPSRGGRISDFGGIWTTHGEELALPLAWAQGRGDRARPKPVPVRSAPAPDARIARLLPPRTIVRPVFEPAHPRFAKIGEGEWVARADLNVAAWTEPPPNVLPGEHWVDVDLGQQVLVAYEGTRPVAATLVASGLADHRTPPGTFRVKWKHALTRMEGRENGRISYRAEVPWTMYYENRYALHAAYWHDRFGAQTSHGCINLAPRDARQLFAWAEPGLPPGWLAAFSVPEYPGLLVRVRFTPLPSY